MNKSVNFRRATISSVYAISLTPEKKRALMRSIYSEVQQSGRTFSEAHVRDLCNRLNQCYEVRYESISCAMEIILKLLRGRVATEEIVQSCRKLLSYVSSVLDAGNCSKLATYMSRISSLVLETEHNASGSFPNQVMKCILVLMYRFPITNIPDRKTILQAVRCLLDWCKTDSKLYHRCGISALVRSVIVSTKTVQDDIAIATELTVLAHHLLDVFFNPQPATVHPVEVLLKLTYDHIFSRLATEWSDVRSFELLLFVLYNLLKRDITLHLKLDIVRILADAVGGGTRRFVRLLCVAKHLRNEVLLHKTKTVLTLALSHALFRYESGRRVRYFKQFLTLIGQMMNSVDLVMVANAKFLCLNIPRASLSIENLCFVFVLRHLDLLEGVSGGTAELDYVYNLIASVNIIYYKRWKIPSFLVKHVVDGLSRFSHNKTFERNVSEPREKLHAILSRASTRVFNHQRSETIFGRLPATVHRIQWLQLQPDDFSPQLIFHQQVAMLQECSILSSDPTRTSLLLATLGTATLVRVLASKKATDTARLNASVLLSKRTLTQSQLRLVMREIHFGCQQQAKQTRPERWTHWLRAVYGSVPMLDSAARRRLWTGLASIEPAVCSHEQCLLLVDMRASLLVAMIPEATPSSPVARRRVEAFDANMRTPGSGISE